MLRPTYVNGLRGYINEAGAEIVPPKYARAGEFHEGLAVVATESDDDRFDSIINESCEPIIEAQDPGISYHDFSEGLAGYWKGYAFGEGGYIDRDGVIVIQPQFDRIDEFSEGVAGVRLPASTRSCGPPNASTFIDHNGIPIFPPKRMLCWGQFREGRCVVRNEEQTSDAIIDKKGNYIVPFGKYRFITDFNNGLARAHSDTAIEHLNIDGDVLQIKYDAIKEYDNEGFSIARTGDLFLIIDRNRNELSSVDLPPTANVDFGFCDGLALASIPDPQNPNDQSTSRFGYIDRMGNLAIDFQFTSAQSFRGTIAAVQSERGDGYINTLGQFVWQP